MVFRLLLAVTELHQNAQARFSKVCIAKYIAMLLRSVVIRKDWCSAFHQCDMCLIPDSTLDLGWICEYYTLRGFFHTLWFPLLKNHTLTWIEGYFSLSGNGRFVSVLWTSHSSSHVSFFFPPFFFGNVFQAFSARGKAEKREDGFYLHQLFGEWRACQWASCNSHTSNVFLLSFFLFFVNCWDVSYSYSEWWRELPWTIPADRAVCYWSTKQ